MIELIKPLLHGNHDNHSTIKCFFAIYCKNVVKNHPISNTFWDHNLQLQDPKPCEVVDLSLLISEVKFLLGWAYQILGRDKTGKWSISQGFEEEFLLFVLEW